MDTHIATIIGAVVMFIVKGILGEGKLNTVISIVVGVIVAFILAFVL